LNGRITKAQIMKYLPGVHFGRSQTIKTIALQRKSFRIKANIVTHSGFLFLDFVPAKKGQLKNYQNISSEFDSTGITGTKFYDVQNSSLELQYQDFLGRTVVVNNNNREQLSCKISKFVLIDDPAYTDPYLAAVLQKPENTWLNNSWATTNKRLNPYPFAEVQNEELSQLALMHFDSLTEYQNIKEIQPAEDATEVRIFEFRKTEKYIVVRYYYLGACSAIEGNYMALYHVTPDNWVREAEGSIDMHFEDLIDIDGDLYPEFLMTGFNQSAIFEINYTGFSKMEFMKWSSLECPC
jgi:hypothetical protein